MVEEKLKEYLEFIEQGFRMERTNDAHPAAGMQHN